MKCSARPVLWLVVALVLAPGGLAWAGASTATLTVYVVSQDGEKAVAGVGVGVTPKGQPAMSAATDAAGRVVFTVPRRVTFFCTVRPAGYSSCLIIKAFGPSDGAGTARVVLRPDEKRAYVAHWRVDREAPPSPATSPSPSPGGR